MVKPAGYWQSWSNLKRELELILEENKGNFPSQKYLKKNGYSMVSSAIHQHGGFPKIRQKMGYSLVRKPNGYWDTEQNIIDEAKKVIETHKLKRLPANAELCKLGHFDLASAIQGNGGYIEFRRKLGEKQVNRNYGTWKNLDYVLEQARLIIQAHSFYVLPGQLTLSKLGYGSFLSAIHKYHGGLNNIRKKLGEKVKEIPNWKNLEFTLKKVKEFLDENNLEELPSTKKIYELGYIGLVRGIARHHSIGKIKKHLGQKEKTRRRGTWENLEYALQEARDAIKEFGADSLPPSDFLSKKGYSSLSSAIQYHGGFRKFRKLLGEKQKKIEDGLLKDFNYAKERILELMQENGWETIPSYDSFRKIGESGLASGIAKYHGGICVFRKKIGKPQLQKSLNYWKDLENIKEEAFNIIKEFKTDILPGSRFLNEHGYSSFVNAVQKYHGGIPAFREKLREYLGRPSEKDQLENMLKDYVGGEDG